MTWYEFLAAVRICRKTQHVHLSLFALFHFCGYPRPWTQKTATYPKLLRAVHKVRHARGGGGPRKCDSLCMCLLHKFSL